jgi:hypothetical protein
LETSTDAAIIPGTAQGSVATLQLRAWDNQGGTIVTWQAARVGSTFGASLLFNSPPLGGVSSPPFLVGLQSFNIANDIIPEPSTLALIGVGAAALLIYGRQKERL